MSKAPPTGKYAEDKRKLVESSKPKIQKYTNGLFSESNYGYNDVRYHNGRAHETQPNKFRATNRGKNIDWTKKYY